MGGVVKTGTPTKQAMILARLMHTHILAILDKLCSPPKMERWKGYRIGTLLHDIDNSWHVLLPVELIHIHLPEVVARGSLGVSLGHLVFFTRPETIWMSLVLRSDNGQLHFGVFFRLETAQHLQSAVG